MTDDDTRILWPGTCKTCGQDLVQHRPGGRDSEPVRTYHPWNVTDPCTAMQAHDGFVYADTTHDQFQEPTPAPEKTAAGTWRVAPSVREDAAALRMLSDEESAAVAANASMPKPHAFTTEELAAHDAEVEARTLGQVSRSLRAAAGDAQDVAGRAIREMADVLDQRIADLAPTIDGGI